MKAKENTREEGIRQVQSIGESLIQNAESIVGTEKYICNVCIRVEINPGTVPKIEISRTFFPEREVEVNRERQIEKMNSMLHREK